MFIGLLMLLFPAAIFLATLPASRRLQPKPRVLYRLVGGFIVIAGSAISLYLAAYTGDQGGIGAYFFQIAVIFVYVVFSFSLVILNWLSNKRASRRHES